MNRSCNHNRYITDLVAYIMSMSDSVTWAMLERGDGLVHWVVDAV